MKSVHHSDSGNTDSENHLFGHSVLENQIQGLSRTRKSPATSIHCVSVSKWNCEYS